MIELKEVQKSFGDKHVLHGVSAVFKAGKPNLIIGASGSGKSVLMKCMVGLMKPTSGKILYEKKDFDNIDYEKIKEIRREIGMLFQGSALFDSLNVEQNVMFPLNMFTNMKKKEKLDRVNFCLKRVQLENVNKLLPSEISGGMKKRVALARAISLNPKYLFCDEPNSGLDPITSRAIDSLISEITEEYNMTTIINTHDMKTVFDIGEHIIYIYKGNKVWDGSKDDITHADSERLQEFVKASVF